MEKDEVIEEEDQGSGGKKWGQGAALRENTGEEDLCGKKPLVDVMIMNNDDSNPRDLRGDAY